MPGEAPAPSGAQWTPPAPHPDCARCGHRHRVTDHEWVGNPRREVEITWDRGCICGCVASGRAYDEADAVGITDHVAEGDDERNVYDDINDCLTSLGDAYDPRTVHPSPRVLDHGWGDRRQASSLESDGPLRDRWGLVDARTRVLRWLGDAQQHVDRLWRLAVRAQRWAGDGGPANHRGATDSAERPRSERNV